MKRFNVVADYPAWTFVGELTKEMLSKSDSFVEKHPFIANNHNPLEPLLIKEFPNLDFDLSLCFRCLDKSSGWVSKARLYKNEYNPNSFVALNNIEESSRTLGFDIVTYTEDFKLITDDKDGQRILLGNELWRFFKNTLPKYKKKIPMTNDELNLMLELLYKWLKEHKWCNIEF